MQSLSWTKLCSTGPDMSPDGPDPLKREYRAQVGNQRTPRTPRAPVRTRSPVSLPAATSQLKQGTLCSLDANRGEQPAGAAPHVPALWIFDAVFVDSEKSAKAQKSTTPSESEGFRQCGSGRWDGTQAWLGGHAAGHAAAAEEAAEAAEGSEGSAEACRAVWFFFGEALSARLRHTMRAAGFERLGALFLPSA